MPASLFSSEFPLLRKKSYLGEHGRINRFYTYSLFLFFEAFEFSNVILSKKQKQEHNDGAKKL